MDQGPARGIEDNRITVRWMSPKDNFILCLALVSALFASGCKREKGAAPVLAQVYAGPITLNLRQEITPASKQVAGVKHGEKLDVIQVRRRFVKLRTSGGTEGWTDARNLLTAEQMENLAELAKRAAKLNSQGEASVYSALNMHADPSRQATSFFQINEGMRVEVVDHELVEKAKPTAAPTTLKVEKPVRPARRKSSREGRVPLPPRGPAPGLPSNWLDMSKTEMTDEEKKAEEEERRNQPKPVMEHWTLVRTKDLSKAGWVLSRNLLMAIPDEVAQYSEGARITAYFPLATVQDGELTKHHWLWTTIRDGEQTFDYDSFRIFIWNLRRHRYETSYIERKVEGYYPTTVKGGKVPTFSLITRAEDGKLYRKTYTLEGYITRKLEEVEWK